MYIEQESNRRDRQKLQMSTDKSISEGYTLKIVYLFGNYDGFSIKFFTLPLPRFNQVHDVWVEYIVSFIRGLGLSVETELEAWHGNSNFEKISDDSVGFFGRYRVFSNL